MPAGWAENTIVAVLPCYNEQDTLGQIIYGVKKYVDMLLVVDDGSHDNTAAIAEQAGAKVLRHRNNIGKGAALQTAFNYIRTIDCFACVILDGDGQHRPDEVPVVLKPVLEGQADIVIGSRFINEAHKIPLHRKFGQIILNYITYWGCRVKVSDSQSGFRAFSRQAVMKMQLTEQGFGVESEMQYIAARDRLIVVEVPISAVYQGKSKRNPFVQGWNVLAGIIRLTVHKQPQVSYHKQTV